MNWTEGTLHRASRRSVKKPNPARQRQKEYFARILSIPHVTPALQHHTDPMVLAALAALMAPGALVDPLHLSYDTTKIWAPQRGLRRPARSNYFEGPRQDQNPNLIHPIPFRAIPSQVYSLDPEQSAYSGSAVAQVGRPISPVPLSQTEENTAWRRWLGESTAASLITDDATIYGRLSPNRADISPGISERRPARDWFQPISAPVEITPSEAEGGSSGGTQWPVNVPSSSEFSQILSQYDAILSKVGLHGSHEESEPEEPQVQLPDNRDPIRTTKATQRGDVRFTPPALPRTPVQDVRPPNEDSSDDAWKLFVFGDDNTDELEEAFNEATKDEARRMQPPDRLTYITEEPLSELDSILAVPGTPFTGSLATPGDLSAAAVSASREATLAPSSAEMPSDLTASSPHAATQLSRTMTEADSSMSPGTDCSTNRDGGPRLAASMEPKCSDQESLDDQTSVAPSAVPSMVTSMAVEPAQSVAGSNEPHFRFAPPKLFVGSRSTHNQVSRPAGAAVPLTFARRQRGRQRKRAHDGRANIRALPNYAGDPIEEIEDEDVLQEELFGPLEFV
ncbi:hypothetical protein QBC34DRAFT_436176 [Podospora aff. communis PSN243]|uniref:Uncharacterized protein n=1 Tax=Podospora aff. communis PSN243 TaxID=3040156 RepID=A0AAV9GWV1_9PEZI|nr:hypothetical protein QBC34DRAFT_436176 [Podospora aff. communis PSN243]